MHLKISIALLGFAVAVAAHAVPISQTNFYVSYTGKDSNTGLIDYGSVILDAQQTTTPGQYFVLGVSGAANGSTITGALLPGTFPTNVPLQNDNFFFYGGSDPYFDLHGVGFSTAAAGNFNLFNGGSTTSPAYFLEAGSGSTESSFAKLSLSVSLTPPTVTPEPSSLALLGTGLLGVVGMARRRFV